MNDADDSIWEEDEENDKAKEFPMETRVNGDEEDDDNEKDVDNIQEHETTEMKEEEEKNSALSLLAYCGQRRPTQVQ